MDFKGVCSNISSIDSERITVRLKLKMQQKATCTGSKMSVMADRTASMNGIFTYTLLYHTNELNVGKYASPIGCYR